jgi:hypothetical protein
VENIVVIRWEGISVKVREVMVKVNKELKKSFEEGFPRVNTSYDVTRLLGVVSRGVYLSVEYDKDTPDIFLRIPYEESLPLFRLLCRRVGKGAFRDTVYRVDLPRVYLKDKEERKKFLDKDIYELCGKG